MFRCANHSTLPCARSIDRTRFTAGEDSSPLTRDDDLLVRIALIEWCELICRDLLPDRPAELSRLCRIFTGTLNVSLLATDLKTLEAAIKQLPEKRSSGAILDLLAFKQQVGTRVVNHHVLSLVCDCLEPFFDGGRLSVASFANSIQICTFWSRLNLRGLDLSKSMLEEYRDQERRMTEWDYTESRDVITDCNDVIREWATFFDERYVCPTNGNGATSEFRRGTSMGQKLTEMHPTDRNRSVFSYLSHNCYFSSDVIDRLGNDPITVPNVSRLQCVPKSVLKNRTISTEPCSQQFLQHGVRHAMDVWFRHPVFHWLSLSDAYRSMDLAREGSVDGEYATLDLSSASDTVTTRLVDSLFADTSLRSWLLLGRSVATIMPDTMEILPLEKFAPMGSDLCFPTMCVVFGAICEVAVRRTLGRRSRKNDYVIYGDDIVVRADCADLVVKILTDLHFEVNVAKSYYYPAIENFREACGMEAYNGFDITPFRISRWLSSPVGAGATPSVDQLAGWVEHLNRLLSNGLLATRKIAMSIAMQYVPGLTGVGFHQISRQNDVYYTPSVATYDDSCTNYRLKKRWNGALFCLEIRCLCNKGERSRDRSSESIRYDEYVRQTFRECDLRSYSSPSRVVTTRERDAGEDARERTSVDPTSPAMGWQWVPE